MNRLKIGDVMKTYLVEIPSVTRIGTAFGVKEIPQLLKDGGCEKRITIELMCDIFEHLLIKEPYYGVVTEDKRYLYRIREVNEDAL